MATTVGPARSIPWWKEPTKEQWMAWWAAWLGWTLDAFDFTVFLLIMVPISKEFGVSLTEVAAVLTITLWMRLVGACGSGWLADRVGRKTPLMLSIAWYSVCNFIAGFSPTFGFLFLFRAVARDHERRLARLVEPGLPAVERRLRALLPVPRVARHVVDRHPARVRGDLRALLR